MLCKIPPLFKIIFLLSGKINKNPTISVAKPGIIKSKAPRAIAAPEITSYVGYSFFLNCKKNTYL